jgi:hypothetical protein
VKGSHKKNKTESLMNLLIRNLQLPYYFYHPFRRSAYHPSRLWFRLLATESPRSPSGSIQCQTLSRTRGYRRVVSNRRRNRRHGEYHRRALLGTTVTVFDLSFWSGFLHRWNGSGQHGAYALGKGEGASNHDLHRGCVFFLHSFQLKTF